MDLRRAASVLLAATLLLVVLGDGGFGQKIPRATCLDCHEKEGMKYATVIVTPLQTLASNETFPFEVTVLNPWLHEITDTRVTLRLATPNLAFEARAPFDDSVDGVVNPFTAAPLELAFIVEPGATGVVVRLTQDAGPSASDLDLFVQAPSLAEPRPTETPDGGEPGPAPGPVRRTEAIVLDAAGASALGTGDWRAIVRPSANPLVQRAPTTATLEAHVFYNATTSQTIRRVALIDEGQTDTFAFPIVGGLEGDARVTVAVELTAHYVHPTGIGAQDDGNQTVTSNLEFTVGSSTTLGEASLVPTELPLNWNIIARTWAEATGWVGLFLTPVSLVLGGAFGRRNVLLANKIARNGRTRLLWHNAVSFVLLGFTIGHIVLFIIEPVYQWSVGLVWGGLGTLALLGLAVTGIWWRDIAKRWSYHTWRTWHLAMAIAFVATVLIHVLAEGAHFDWARDALGLT